MEIYIPIDIVENHILAQCDSDYLITLLHQATASGDHAFIMDTIYKTIKKKDKLQNTALRMIFMEYIIKHYNYKTIAKVKKELEITCFKDFDDVVEEVLKHPDDRVFNLFCAPCSICAGEIIPSAIWLKLSHKIWDANFVVVPTLYDVLLMMQVEDRVGLKAFFRRLKHNYKWIQILRNDASNYIDEMEEGVYTDEDATLGLLCNISHLIHQKHSNKDARWVYKNLKYFQKIIQISYFVESCEEYFIHIEDAVEDYDY